MDPRLQILYEDNHLLALNKPADLATQGVEAEAPSLARLAKHYLKQRYQKPGNVYLGVMSRLDAPATGVVLLARTSKAAARLTEQFRTRAVEKTYWALVADIPSPTSGDLVDWLRKDEARQRMTRATEGAGDAKLARLHYRLVQPIAAGAWLEIELFTGRKHQIRIQLAAQGWPIFGDRKYGSEQKFALGIALHARRLVVQHPVRDEPLELIAPLPTAWNRFGIR